MGCAGLQALTNGCMCGHFDAQYPEKELQSCAQREPRSSPFPGLCVRSVNTAGPAQTVAEDSDSHSLNSAGLTDLCRLLTLPFLNFLYFFNHYTFG